MADALDLLADGFRALATALRHAPIGVPAPDKPESPPSVKHMLLTPKQLAAELNVAEQTLAKWRLSGEGPRYRKLGHLVRYDREEVLQWVAERRYAHTAEEQKGGDR